VHAHTCPGPGESGPFHLLSCWQVSSTAELTWHVLADVAAWPTWWPGVVSAEVVRPGSAGGVGRSAVLEVRSVLGYRLSFQVELTSAEAPHRAHLAVSGDLRGTGSWTAEEHDWRTSMQIVWCVVTSRRVLRVLRPVAGWAHGRTMAAGQAGLRRRLAPSS